MTPQRLHIVCFDIPFPPTYGGAIDVYYRIKALAQAGASIILHCTYKGTLTHYAELENLCEKVYYYPRQISLRHLLGRLPLAVAGRPNYDILQNLLLDDAPILYEGLVSCGTLAAPELSNREKYFRECNVEHDYYRALAKAGHSWRDKCYYLLEARRLKRFEHMLVYATRIFALAHQDEAHFVATYPSVPTTYLPCFHSHTQISCPTGIGSGILYHGNFRVEENQKAAAYILNKIAPQLPDIPFIIAGAEANTLKPQSKNVTIVSNPDQSTMQRLVAEAQLHLLVTFQATGLKLKLLNVLYEGRHVICNSQMVYGTELADLCLIADDPQQQINLCRQLYHTPFTQDEIIRRTEKLKPFDNTTLTQQLLTNLCHKHENQ
ncbi:MAG: glycosyltransferase family 1 protein [Paludibacteraceae bacterium]|nr:glycosyltransferase family 1 protein [Paludibacteraceae bacterium]